MKNRKEYDSIGGINVPVDKYWGASTQRSSKYFDIGDFLVRPIVIKSIAIIKKAVAIVNTKNGDLDKRANTVSQLTQQISNEISILHLDCQPETLRSKSTLNDKRKIDLDKRGIVD